MRTVFSFAPPLILNVCLCVAVVGQSARAAEPESQSSRNNIALEALSRLKGIDLEANPAIKAAVMKVLESTKGTPQFVELVREFRIQDQNPALLEIAIANATNSTGVDAARLILENDGLDLLKQSLASTNSNMAATTAILLGNIAEKKVVPLLVAVTSDGRQDLVVRKEATRSLAKTHEGAAALLRLASEEKLTPDLKLLASAELKGARWVDIKQEAARRLPLPDASDSEDLPPVAELVKMKGNPVVGAQVFSRETVACANCHQVNGVGIDFGPKLSEIGSKLGKDALYAAILDPSSGISFGYEAWEIILKNGDEAFGLIASETAEELAIKAQNGIVTRYNKRDIAKREQMKTSIMPAGLQHAMSLQELVDLIEYLASLKKSGDSN